MLLLLLLLPAAVAGVVACWPRLRSPLSAAMLLSSMVVVGCGGSPVATEAPTAPLASSPPAPATAAQGSPVVLASPSAALFRLAATWQRDQTCSETAQLFESLDLHALGAEYITNLGFRSETPEVVAAEADLCTGASGPKARTLTFGAGGNWNGTLVGEQVDLGRFSIVDEKSILLHGDPGDPEVTLVYEVDGDAVTFTVEPPEPCTDQACVEQVAWARETFELGPWTRAAPTS